MRNQAPNRRPRPRPSVNPEPSVQVVPERKGASKPASTPRREPTPKSVGKKRPASPKGQQALVIPAARLDFEHASSTSMFETLGGIRALPANEVSRAIVLGNLRDVRGYTPSQIEALSQLGYHYLRCGSYRLAGAIFDGLAAIDPNNAWVALARGLSLDYRGDKAAARIEYTRAAQLDPRDATPLINLAELELEAMNRAAAKKHLLRASKVALTANNDALNRKAKALLKLAAR